MNVMNIGVDVASCIRCGRCVKVCPSLIFVQARTGSDISLKMPENCIVCGHCVAVCPTGSVRHEEFPPEKVHKTDFAGLPTPEQVMLLCEARRSNRAISDKAVPEELLDRIVSAAHLAPTASNKQQVAFTLVTDTAMLRGVSEYTLGVFETIARRLSHPLVRPWLKRIIPGTYEYLPLFGRMRRDYAEGHDRILRGATAVLFIHTPKENRFGAEDANLAYQNGSLMAEALGVSQIYMGFVLMALRQDKKCFLNKMLGLEQRRIGAVMALGMPQFPYPNYIDRRRIEVKKI